MKKVVKPALLVGYKGRCYNTIMFSKKNGNWEVLQQKIKVHEKHD